jgi:hypothetical protein
MLTSSTQSKGSAFVGDARGAWFDSGLEAQSYTTRTPANTLRSIAIPLQCLFQEATLADNERVVLETQFGVHVQTLRPTLTEFDGRPRRELWEADGTICTRSLESALRPLAQSQPQP